MQYNGLGSNYAAPPSQSRPAFAQAARSISYGYHADTPPRSGSSDMAGASWRSMSASGQSHHGVFLNSADTHKATSPIPFHRNDVVARHLLVETALLDSQDFELLAIEEVDALKKEKVQLDSRLDATRRKLALESKVRDAAQSLHRLYSGKGRPVTPQSDKKNRRSLLGERSRSSSGNGPSTLNQAGDELASSSKKIDELMQILSGLESRRQYVESRLLRHTAAVLQVAHDDDSTLTANGLQIDVPFDDSETTFTNNTVPRSQRNAYEESLYSNDQMEGFIPRTNGDSRKTQKSYPSFMSITKPSMEHNEKIGQVHDRLKALNSQMRSIIEQARDGQMNGDKQLVDDPPSAFVDGDDSVGQLGGQIEVMDKSVELLQRHYGTLKTEHDRLLDEHKHQQHAMEGRLEDINNQLYDILSERRDEDSSDIQAPPAISGHGAQGQISYLEENILTVEQILQQSAESFRGTHEDMSRDLETTKAKAGEHADKSSNYEAVLLGLWGIISSNDNDNNKEPFSLQAFSTRVQHMFERASHHDEQMDILRRQIAQQRELNSKSDGEKDRQLTDLQTSHADLGEQLLQARAQHAAAETETGDARSEILSVMNELERLKETATAHAEQKQQAMKELEEHRSRAHDLESALADHEAHISELQDDARLSDAETQARHRDHEARLQNLTKDLSDAHAARDGAEARFSEKESEVVRLISEVAMVRAELDGAYGSRAERAKDVLKNPEVQAQLNKLEELTQHNMNMTTELEALRSEKDSHLRQIQDLSEKHSMAEQRGTTLDREMNALKVQSDGTAKNGSRTAMLEKELTEMAVEYQELTRESVEVEKEREQLESLVDGLRQRCEVLESQLSDERVRWLGIKSPTQSVMGEPGREMTSTMVLRNEFKKMMRETRAEGVRLLRAEQEERRKLEATLREIRRENMPAKSGLAAR